MKRLLFSVAIAAALGAGSFAGFRALNPAERQLSDIELANVEALADFELPQIPCTTSLTNCTFLARTAQGTLGNITLYNQVKVGVSF